MTWKEEKIIHLSSWLGVQSWRDQESNRAHPPADKPDKAYWLAGASISCKTTFLSSGLQCFSPFYCIFWTQLYNQQTFLHLQTLLRKFHLFPHRKSSAPLKLILSNWCALPQPLTLEAYSEHLQYTLPSVRTSVPGLPSSSSSHILLSC